jgi:hypothetical protein
MTNRCGMFKKGTFICQIKYNLDMLNKFDMDNVKPIKIPMASSGHLDLDKNEKAVSQNVYRSVIESLLCICASKYRGESRRGAAGATVPVAPHNTYFMTRPNNTYFICLKIVVFNLGNY